MGHPHDGHGARNRRYERRAEPHVRAGLGGPAEEVVRQIRHAGGEATAVRADLSDPAQVQPLFDAARKTYGRVDILVNNAGVSVTWPVEEASPARYEELFNLRNGPGISSLFHDELGIAR
jgi:NAD(P)-dependent dehydrogenase (short-subunit alcohol dehydrogenase family)